MLTYLVVYNRRQLLYNITDKDYKFTSRDGDALHTVELLTGIYKNTRYQYGQVRTTVSEEDQPLKLSFQWSLVRGEDSLTKDKDFNNYIGAVLQNIMEQALEDGNFKIGMKNGADSTDNNTEESTPQ